MSNILAVPEWLPYGVAQHVTGDNDPVYGVNGTINQTPKTLWTHMQALMPAVDTLQVEWISASSVKVLSGGVCWSDDGVQGYQLTSDITVTLSSLSNSTAYFLWIGEESSTITVKVGADFDDSTVPSGLTNAHRLPGWFLTDGSGNVIQFDTNPLPHFRTGEIIEWAGRYAPYGTCIADGSVRTRTGAPFERGFTLFDTAFGVGDGSTTYNIPSHRGRCAIGAGQGSGLTDRTFGSTLGEEDHALIEAENAAHTHNCPRYSSNGSATTSNIHSSATVGYPEATTSSGLGTAHNTMQPSIIINYVLAL